MSPSSNATIVASIASAKDMPTEVVDDDGGLFFDRFLGGCLRRCLGAVVRGFRWLGWLPIAPAPHPRGRRPPRRRWSRSYPSAGPTLHSLSWVPSAGGQVARQSRSSTARSGCLGGRADGPLRRSSVSRLPNPGPSGKTCASIALDSRSRSREEQELGQVDRRRRRARSCPGVTPCTASTREAGRLGEQRQLARREAGRPEVELALGAVRRPAASRARG